MIAEVRDVLHDACLTESHRRRRRLRKTRAPARAKGKSYLALLGIVGCYHCRKQDEQYDQQYQDSYSPARARNALDGRINVVDPEVDGPVLGIESIVLYRNRDDVARNRLLRTSTDVAWKP